MNRTHAVGHHTSPECQGPHKTLFFRDRGIEVTDGCVQVHGRWHPISCINRLWVARGSSGAMPVVAFVSAIGVALAGCVLFVAIDALPDRVLVGGVVAVTTTIVGVAGIVRWLGRPHELWVSCCGDEMMLYATRDRVAFGKLQRALWRAMNATGSKPSASPDEG